MGYIIIIILCIIFFIWLFYIELRGKQQHTDEQPKIQIKENSSVRRCPRCGSTQITVVKRGWKVSTGFLGSSKNERVCTNCMKKF